MIQCAIFVFSFLGFYQVNDSLLKKYHKPAVHVADTITIGFLVESTNKDQDAIQAAQLALNQANKSETSKGKYFKLAHRATEGPWGLASKMCVELIFEERAIAIVGSLDGRTAHLAEQVIAKSHIPYLETKATDPTLSKAFVPWFYQLVPNDQQISVALVENIYKVNNYTKVAVLSDQTYDSKKSAETFKKVIAQKQFTEPDYFPVDSQDPGFKNSLSQLISQNYDAIVLFAQPAIQDARLIHLLEVTESTIYCGSYPTNQITLQPGYPFYTIFFVANQPKYEKFIHQFQNLTNRIPSVQAVYTYDAINLLIQVIIEKGSKPEIIGKQIGIMDGYDGISGNIGFNDHGNLTRSFEFVAVNVSNR